MFLLIDSYTNEKFAVPSNLNTSHVLINLRINFSFCVVYKHLNTSHVLINLLTCLSGLNSSKNLNTSHVLINPV